MADQWEYREVVIERGDDRLAHLNQLGTEGWELVTAEPVWRWLLLLPAQTEDRLLLKRRKP